MKLIAGIFALAAATEEAGDACPTGWSAGTDDATADDCFPNEVEVDCQANSIVITADIDSVYFDGIAELSDAQKDLATIVAVNADEDETCDDVWSYNSETGKFTITHDLTACGMEATHDSENGLLVFSNSYTGTEAALDVDGIITTKVLSFSAQCSYPDQAIVTADGIDVTMGENVAEAVASTSEFEFTLSTYTADDQLISAENKAEIGEQIKLTVTPNADLPSNVQFQLVGCTAADSMDDGVIPEDAATYEILEEGSCTSDLLDAALSGAGQSSESVSLLFNSFTFEAEDDQLALSCSLKLCLTTDDACNRAAQSVDEYVCPEKYTRDTWWTETYGN